MNKNNGYVKFILHFYMFLVRLFNLKWAMINAAMKEI